MKPSRYLGCLDWRFSRRRHHLGLPYFVAADLVIKAAILDHSGQFAAL